MSNAAYFSTFVLNIAICSICALGLIDLIRLAKLSKAGGMGLYFLVVLIVVVASPYLAYLLVRLYEWLGNDQDLGHTFYAAVLVLNAGLGLVSLAVGEVALYKCRSQMPTKGLG